MRLRSCRVSSSGYQGAGEGTRALVHTTSCASYCVYQISRRSCRQPLDQHIGARRAKLRELRGVADRPRNYGAIAFGIAKAGEESGGRLGQEPQRTAAVQCRLALELGNGRGAEPAAAQRRQNDQRTQERIFAVDLEAAEARRDRIDGFEAP